MAQWDGNESSCACDCGFDIPKGGTLDALTLKAPLAMLSGGLGATDAAGGRHNLGIYVGRSGANTISATSPKSVSITFDDAFATPPHVIVCPGFAGNSTEGVGIFAYLQEITTTGCTVRLATNFTGNASNVYVFWIAVGDVAE